MAGLHPLPPAIARGANVNLMTRLEVMRKRREWRMDWKRYDALKHFREELNYDLAQGNL